MFVYITCGCGYNFIMVKPVGFLNGLGEAVIFNSLRKSSLKWFGTIRFVVITAAYRRGNHNENEILIHDQGNRSWSLYHLNVNGSDVNISKGRVMVCLILSRIKKYYTYSMNRLKNSTFCRRGYISKNDYLRQPCKYLDDLIKNEFGQ